ncbi:Pycsar system effector family protein [Hansschlegelia sp.]|uniref:Pycsar system effector family protein n=1 Tax=Hansschlegelia sp. TaxID=2041892 RepID=UPI002B71DA11|nr:Pycsar system effector family protein [Hansschlegelia sp.]HVI27905.1 Pycsar system effector family protein [Hansschlegelia sp.]
MRGGEDGLSYLRSINDTFYDQLKVADQKATLIMSLIMLMIIWSPDVRHAFLGALEVPAAPTSVFAASLFVTGALTISLLSALWVIIPRRRPGGPLFWGGWPTARQVALDLAMTGDVTAIAQSYADNAANLAVICHKKYRFVGIALWALILGIGGHVCFLLSR